jgi:hypothetical protein
MWKRIIDGKRIQFEVDFTLNGKVNFENVCLSKSQIEKDYLVESVQSVMEEYFFDKRKKREENIKINEEIKDQKTKVRNHFRNVCFRKKFNTIKEHITYVAKYYGINDMEVLSFVEEDLPIIKKQSGLH